MSFKIKLAGKVIEINNLYPLVETMCRDYLVENNTPDLSITINDEDIKEEYRLSPQKDYAVSEFRNGYLETLAVYRKIAESILSFDTLLMHGAVLAKDGYSYMFTAISGTGKTTVIRSLLKEDHDLFVVNGDKPLIKVSDSQALAYGTPWSGKEHMNNNCEVPLTSICILERGKENKVEKIDFLKALPVLIQQTYHFEDEEKAINCIDLLTKLEKHISFYHVVMKYYEKVEDIDTAEIAAMFNKYIRK